MKKIFTLFTALLLTGAMWGTTVKDAVYTFGSSSTPAGWTVSSKNTHVANYLKLSQGDYLEMTTADVFAAGELLSSATMDVELSCGTFGTWGETKKYVTCTIDLRDSNGSVLSTANATFSNLTSSEGAYKDTIQVSKPTDPSQIAYMRITFSNYGNSTAILRVKYVRLNYSTELPVTNVENPSFTPSETSFANSVDVSLSCGTDGATIYYTLDGSDPKTSGTKITYTQAFTLTDTTTVKAVAVKDEDASSVVTKTYTKYGPLTCAELASRGNGVSALLGEVTVNYVNGRYIYVKDNTGVILIYDKNDVDLGLAVGNVVSGFEGTVSIYKNLLEVVPKVEASDLTVNTEGDAPDPVVLETAPTVDDINKYVVLNDVTVEPGSFTSGNTYSTLDLTIGDNVVTLINTFGKDFTFAGGTKYNVVATVAISSTTIQLYFISATEKECDKKVTIVKGTPEEGGSFNLDITGEQNCCNTLTVTVSDITAPSGKQFSAITQTGVASGVTIDQNAKTVTYEANSTGTSTINVTFIDLPKYTVTLKDDDTELQQTSYGASVTLPSREGCTNYTFAGWTKSWTSAQSSWTNVAPAIIPAGSYTPEEDENLYPVYTKTSGPEGFINYEKVTTDLSDWSGKYLISDGENTADGGVLPATGTATALTITPFVPGTTEATNYEFSIVKNGTNANYYIICPDGETYVGVATSGANLALTTDQTKLSNYYLWTFSKDDPMSANVARTDRYIGVGVQSQTDVFKAYATSGTNAKCYFYKRNEGIPTYYISIPECGGETAISNTEAGEKAVKTLVNGQLVIEKNGVRYNAMGQIIR